MSPEGFGAPNEWNFDGRRDTLLSNSTQSQGYNMSKSIFKRSFVVLGLLCSATGFAATVTLVPSTTAVYFPGESFYVDVFGSGFPDTVGATLHLTFSSAVSIATPTTTAGIVIPAGSPFTGGIVAPSPFLSGNILSVLAPTVGTLPTGNFGGNPAFRINFVATVTCVVAPCPANIQLVDDQADFSWTDATTFQAIPVTYTQANVNVYVEPVPAAAFLFPSALAALGWLRRKRS
jgi:hypothetical protein